MALCRVHTSTKAQYFPSTELNRATLRDSYLLHMPEFSHRNSCIKHREINKNVEKGPIFIKVIKIPGSAP